ncbi:myotubularin-related protein 6 isoform X2 [Culicoides brevitarsis]|uniref:myotubularin-related protein 6 isoform X2 n=1 Tax=Culicoides brevitarsis TaxID=469753 RepID=UPI00307BCBA9
MPEFVPDEFVSWVEHLQEEPHYELHGTDVVKKVENVRMVDRYNTKNPSLGTLYLTATHLIFVDPEINKETWILHMRIASVERLPLTTTGSPLLIRCKNFLSVTFIVPKERDCHDVYQTLQKLCQPVKYENLYCFQYQSRTDDLPKTAGWDFFRLENEFKRMKVPNSEWTLSTLNQNYELCDTYPKQIYVPALASTAMLLGSSRFRSKGRLPALTYLHPNKASISRCSQPLSGFSARCLEDEQLLEAVRKTNPNSNYMYVVDTRPRINAMANRAAGKGYENEAFYENTKFHFLGIENIHIMRASLQKLVETCEQKSPTMSSFLSSLESSGWLKHIRAILDTSSFIANAVDKGTSVVVHCSDGWDRTAQVCSLAAVMLDPYYRTIKGYQALIEKDWLAFGHKFSERCGHIQTDPKEVSPVFTQFLEGTWQLMQQRFDAFEFNERFLLTLHDNVQSCQFGTFIGNCEKDRLDLRLSETTYSLWGHMSNHLNEYVNPLYRPEMDETVLPDLAPQNIKFWRGMYNRFEEVHPREPIEDILSTVHDHCTSLEDHVQFLTKRISGIKSMISKSSQKILQNTRFGADVKAPEVNDNKYNYDKKNVRSCANDDHPLKGDTFSFANLSVSENQDEGEASPSAGSCSNSDILDNNVRDIAKELDSVAVDWKSLRSVTVCPCSTPFDQFNRKTHCWRCGEVFCTRCIDKSIPLPGHDSMEPRPVCRACFKLISDATPS